MGPESTDTRMSYYPNSRWVNTSSDHALRVQIDMCRRENDALRRDISKLRRELADCQSRLSRHEWRHVHSADRYRATAALSLLVFALVAAAELL